MKRIVAIAGIVLLMSCGSGVNEGIFNDGLITGLHYKTATQEGLTNTKGQFKYKDGETVTFSIGGIVLGSAKAASRVTPFDLIGFKVPSSEAELAPKIRRMPMPFRRVSNMAFLLYALDKDGNANNGIDLTGFDATLATARLALGSDFAYYYSLLAAQYGLRDPNSVPVGAPLQHLYDALGIHVRFHALATMAHDAGNNGSIESRDSEQYDPSNGLLASETSDTDGDGTDDHTQAFTYDAAGRVLTNETQTTQGPAVDSAYTYTYTENGDLATSSRVVHNAGVLTETHAVTQTWNAAGEELSFDETNSDTGQPTTTDNTTFSYDATGHSTGFEETATKGGAVTKHTTGTVSVDALGNSTSVSITTSTPSAATDGKITGTEVVNADGSEASYTQVFDYGNNGSVDMTVKTTESYDADGNNTQYLGETYDGGGALQTRTTYAYSYDVAGNLLTSDDTQDNDGDGHDDTASHVVRTYDVFGNALTEVSSEDSDGDGHANSIVTVTETYDNDSNLTSERIDYDYDADGTIDSTDVTTYTYVEVAGEVQAAVNRAYND